MGAHLRMTPALRAVVTHFLESDGEVWGLRLVDKTGRPTGTVYPILERLQRHGFITSRWDDDLERRGPRRRLYRVTPEGRAWMTARLGTVRGGGQLR